MKNDKTQERNKRAVAKSNKETRHTFGRSRPGVSLPAPPPLAEMPENYGRLLEELKQRITTERLRVTMAANAAMVLLYWDIGQAILKWQESEGWGARVIDRLSNDLSKAFPDMRGLSPRNLKYMRAFAEAWPNRAIVQQLAAQIPWFHNCLLLDKTQDVSTREWYIRATIEHGWSRNVLAIQIAAQAHKRQGKAVTNFRATLPPADSDMAAFNLDFLCIHPFRDGNGRVSRLLLLLQCYHLGYEVGRYISVERLIEQNKERYYETLEQSSEGWHEAKHDPWPYVNYLLYTLKTAYREFEDRVGQIASPKGAKSEMVLNAIRAQRGEFRLVDIERACPGVGREWIRVLLADLKKSGEVKCRGKGPAARWVYKGRKGSTLK